MKSTAAIFALGILIIFMSPPAAAQQTGGGGAKVESAPEGVSATTGGHVEFGFRTFWGDVYGRPDLPFSPNLATSKLNEYNDIRDNFYIRRANIFRDNVLGTPTYVKYQTQNSLYRNQSHLATVGQYGKYKAQFQFDDTPHIYSNTVRTLYAEAQPGVYTLPLTLRQALQTASSTGTAAQINNSLPSFIATQVEPSLQFYTPQILRRSGAGLFSYDVTPDWNLGVSFEREHQKGTRPIGGFLYTSPSAGGSTQPGTTANRQSPGSGAELPEPIDYFTNTLRALTEVGRGNWAIQGGYDGSFFKSRIDSLIFDAPFATADIPVQIIPPGSGCTPSGTAVNCAISAVPSRGQMGTYPDNRANYLNLAGAFDAGSYVRVMGSAVNGWIRQNEPFLPYTINSAITGVAPLPASSLNGNRHTLSMNWTAVSSLGKSVQLQAKYRHYDYNNNTGVLELTPIVADVIGANATATGQAAPALQDTSGRSNIGFNRKTLELSGNYFFGRRNSAKFGWEGEWFDRAHRDVAHSMENTVFAAVDFVPARDLTLRISGRHQNREPNEYQSELSHDPLTGEAVTCTSTNPAFTDEQRCSRRFDQGARILDRGDVILQYDLRQFSFGGSFQTTQIDFNRPGGVNSPTPLNFVTGATRPYYLYGNMNDLAWTYAFDTTYSFSSAASVFVEYTRENYSKRMISRSRTPPTGTATILTCNGCDTPNNDWESTARDVFNTYAAGLDLFLGGRVWLSPYYSLADGKGNVFSRALGNPAITTGQHQFALTGTSTPEDYPQTTTRIHEAAAVFKFKISENLMPRFEYRLQQFDNRDYQTTVMRPYMGCVGAGAIVVSSPCVNVGPSLLSRSPSPVYPGFVVGDTAAARYLFLGVDQPSYRAHVITATLEYHF
jgi:hypothetical protein